MVYLPSCFKRVVGSLMCGAIACLPAPAVCQQNQKPIQGSFDIKGASVKLTVDKIAQLGFVASGANKNMLCNNEIYRFGKASIMPGSMLCEIDINSKLFPDSFKTIGGMQTGSVQFTAYKGQICSLIFIMGPQVSQYGNPLFDALVTKYGHPSPANDGSGWWWVSTDDQKMNAYQKFITLEKPSCNDQLKNDFAVWKRSWEKEKEGKDAAQKLKSKNDF